MDPTQVPGAQQPDALMQAIMAQQQMQRNQQMQNQQGIGQVPLSNIAAQQSAMPAPPAGMLTDPASMTGGLGQVPTSQVPQAPPNPVAQALMSQIPGQ